MNRVGRGSNQGFYRGSVGDDNKKTEVSGVSLGQKKLKVSLVDNKKNKSKLARLKKFFGLKPKEFESLRARSVQVVKDVPTEGKVKGQELFGPKATKQLAAYNEGAKQVNITREAIHQRFENSDQAVGRQDAEEYKNVLEMFSSQFGQQGYNDKVLTKMQETIEALKEQMVSDQTFLDNNQREIDSLRNRLFEQEGRLEGSVQDIGTAIENDRDEALNDWVAQFSEQVVDIVAEAKRKRTEKKDKLKNKIKKNKDDMEKLKTDLDDFLGKKKDYKDQIERKTARIDSLESGVAMFDAIGEMVKEHGGMDESDTNLQEKVGQAGKSLEHVSEYVKYIKELGITSLRDLKAKRIEFKQEIDRLKDERTRLRKRKVKLKLLVVDNWIDGQAFQSRVQRKIDELEKKMGKDLDVLIERRQKQFKTLLPYMPDLKVRGVGPGERRKMKKAKVKEQMQMLAASASNATKPPVPARRISISHPMEANVNNAEPVARRSMPLPPPPPEFADEPQSPMPDVVPANDPARNQEAGIDIDAVSQAAFTYFEKGRGDLDTVYRTGGYTDEVKAKYTLEVIDNLKPDLIGAGFPDNNPDDLHQVATEIANIEGRDVESIQKILTQWDEKQRQGKGPQGNDEGPVYIDDFELD